MYNKKDMADSIMDFADTIYHKYQNELVKEIDIAFKYNTVMYHATTESKVHEKVGKNLMKMYERFYNTLDYESLLKWQVTASRKYNVPTLFANFYIDEQKRYMVVISASNHKLKLGFSSCFVYCRETRKMQAFVPEGRTATNMNDIK